LDQADFCRALAAATSTSSSSIDSGLMLLCDALHLFSFDPLLNSALALLHSTLTAVCEQLAKQDFVKALPSEFKSDSPAIAQTDNVLAISTSQVVEPASAKLSSDEAACCVGAHKLVISKAASSVLGYVCESVFSNFCVF